MPRLTKTDYAALSDLRYQIRRFVNFSDEAARDAGIEPQQHQLLLALKGQPAGEKPTIGFVAERLQIVHHSAVELVSRSVLRGLIERRRSEADRREAVLRVTARGERVLEALSLAHRDELRSAAPVLARALKALVAGQARKSMAQKKKRTGHAE